MSEALGTRPSYTRADVLIIIFRMVEPSSHGVLDSWARFQAEFEDVATRLHRDFDGLASPHRVDETVAAIADSYRDARVLTFVPVLVERQARSVLRSTQSASRS